MNHRVKMGRESHLKPVPCLCQDGVLTAIGWSPGALDLILLDSILDSMLPGALDFILPSALNYIPQIRSTT